MPSSYTIQLWFHEFLSVYMPVIVGCLAQFFFLLLPVDLKNWNDDLLNVLTYMGVQIFVAGIIFIGIPLSFELYSLPLAVYFYILLLVGLFSWFKAIKTIPLEATSLGTPSEPTLKRPSVQFNELMDPARMALLVEAANSGTNDGGTRYLQIKERLMRRKPEKVDQVGG